MTEPILLLWHHLAGNQNETLRILCFFLSGRPVMQAVGREKRALAVLGEAIDKWEGGGGSCSDSGRHEAFFDRGVIRYGARRD